MDREPPIEAAWDKNNGDDAVSDVGDMKEDFMSKIDGEIDFDERYEVVGCIELSSASSAYARFKFVYFFLSLSEQFGFYWITLYGTIKYGYSRWLNWYIICLAFAGFISAFTSSIIGRLSDRYGRKYIILLSILIQSIPYIPLILLPNKIEYFLYLLPIIGFCGSISTLTGVMKAYIVDILPKRFLISGFAKLISIYGGAGILSSIIIYSIIGNEIRNFFIENDFINFTTQIIMIITIGLYIFTFILFSIIVPESLYPDYKLKYSSRINPCHGINIALCNNKGVIIYTLLFIFFCSFAQIGMMAIIQDIFLIDFDLTNSINNRIDLINGTDNNTNGSGGSIYDILSDDLAIYGAFLFTLGCTLICAPCCIKCYCGKALTNMLCSMILMILSFCIIIFLLISNEWYTFIISLICGILFAMGEIGFVFLNGSIAKYINSKQYGIAYGLLHSIYSLSKACSPYIFYLLFEIFIQNNIQLITTNQSILGKAKPIVYIAILLTIIGTFIGLFAIKKSMRSYKLTHQNMQVAINNDNRHDYDRKHSQFDEGEMKNYDNEQVLSIHNENVSNENNNIEMQPPPMAPNNNSVRIIHNSNHNHQVQPSAVSSVYIIGHNAPQYQQQPYIAQSVNGHQPQWTVMQQQQQQQQQQPVPYNNLPSSSYNIQPYSQHNSQPGYVASDVV